MASDAQTQAGRDFLNLCCKKQAERQQKVLQFLRLNPGSTSDEIWLDTGCSWDNAQKFVKRFRRKKDRRMVYRVDEKKILRFLTKK